MTEASRFQTADHGPGAHALRRSGGFRLGLRAYVGVAGGADIVADHEIGMHLDLCWTDPDIHRNYERLAGFSRSAVRVANALQRRRARASRP